MPWEELEEAYAPQFNATIGAPAKPVRLAFGALYIKQRLGLTDEEAVDQIRENPYIQIFLGFEGYTSKKPFDPSMMVHFRKRLTDDDLRRCQGRVDGLAADPRSGAGGLHPRSQGQERAGAGMVLND